MLLDLPFRIVQQYVHDMYSTYPYIHIYLIYNNINIYVATYYIYLYFLYMT